MGVSGVENVCIDFIGTRFVGGNHRFCRNILFRWRILNESGEKSCGHEVRFARMHFFLENEPNPTLTYRHHAILANKIQVSLVNSPERTHVLFEPGDMRNLIQERTNEGSLHNPTMKVVCSE